MNNLGNVKSEISQIVLKNSLQENWDNLINYFDNLSDFYLIEKKDGLPGNGYFDTEEYERHKYRKYKSMNDNFVIKVSVYDFREIMIAVNKGHKFNGYSLELNTQSEGAIPEYKIV